jgi:hypothetical protein
LRWVTARCVPRRREAGKADGIPTLRWREESATVQVELAPRGQGKLASTTQVIALGLPCLPCLPCPPRAEAKGLQAKGLQPKGLQPEGLPKDASATRPDHQGRSRRRTSTDYIVPWWYWILAP